MQFQPKFIIFGKKKLKMGSYIKYQRFVKEFTTEEEIQPFLDELIKGGWEIISYIEEKKIKTIILPAEVNSTVHTTATIEVIDAVILAGKQANIIKNVL